MADFYTDWTNGNDTTGDGSSGNPYKSIEKVAALGSGMSSSGGNRIFVANTSAQVATATGATWSASWLGIDGVGNPTLILPWDNGGSITLTLPNGKVIAPAFEWDGNDAVASLATDLIGLSVFGCYMHTTTSFVWNPNASGCFLICCKVADGGGTALVDANLACAIGCHFVGDATSSQDGLGAVYGALYCFFDDFTGKAIMVQGGAFCVGNVIRNCDEGGISGNVNSVIAAQNTLIGNSSANSYGLDMSGTSADSWAFFENVIQDFSGSGAKGIRVTSGAVPVICMGHSFWNNTTNSDSGALYEHEADTEADDPLVDATGGDFSVEVASAAYQSSHLGPDPANRGASQKDNGVGGGGATSHAYFS